MPASAATLTDTALVRMLHERGLTRRQIAEATDCHPRTVTRWLAGDPIARRGLVRPVLERMLAEVERG